MGVVRPLRAGVATLATAGLAIGRRPPPAPGPARPPPPAPPPTPPPAT